LLAAVQTLAREAMPDTEQFGAGLFACRPVSWHGPVSYDHVSRNEFPGVAMNIVRWGAVLVAGFLIVLAECCDEPRAAAALRPAQVAQPSEFRGAGSCSATACHGSVTPLAGSAVRRNEHTTWITEDPHARAYLTLLGKRSERIACNLAAAPAQFKPAYEDERCLACHTTLRPAIERKATSWMNPDGVGCESCHGASGRWMGPHTISGWRKKGRELKESLGMSDTKTLVSRGKVCAGCHVGSRIGGGMPTRDVNHDLIAAGHPRLNFELAAYLDNMPAHWDEQGENSGRVGPTHRAEDFPARAWAIGQLVTELASLQLLMGRAADPNAPWPEFAEYNCFSCHHDLRDDAWRSRPRNDAATAGTLRWGSRMTPPADELIKQFVVDPAPEPYTKSLEQRSAEMSKTVPNRTTVANQAREASGPLSLCLTVLGTKRFKADDVEQLIKKVDSRRAWDRVGSWDDAVGVYLALAALHKAWVELDLARKKDQETFAARLESLRPRLEFPAGFDSPRAFDPVRLRP
jgi:hypothetical protein